MITRLISLTGAVSLTLVLAACDFVFERSKFNLDSEQIARVENAAIVDRGEFKINMTKFLAQQINDVETHLLANKYKKSDNQIYRECFLSQKPDISALMSASGLDALMNDKIIRAVLETVQIGGVPAAASTVGGEALGYADFENALRLITDAGTAGSGALNLHGVKVDGYGNRPFISLLFPKVPGQRHPKEHPLIAYFGAYYNGAFVDHFGNTIAQPSIENGIDDGTIASFFQVLVELLADLVKPQLGTLVSEGPIYHPKDDEPTYHKVFNLKYQVKATGESGISAKEAKVISTGANVVAEQGLTLFSGFFEALSEIHLGFIIAGNFAVGSNDTLKSFARAVVETSLRRGAERGFYCLVERYDLDAVADIIERVVNAER